MFNARKLKVNTTTPQAPTFGELIISPDASVLTSSYKAADWRVGSRLATFDGDHISRTPFLPGLIVRELKHGADE